MRRSPGGRPAANAPTTGQSTIIGSDFCRKHVVAFKTKIVGLPAPSYKESGAAHARERGNAITEPAERVLFLSDDDNLIGQIEINGVCAFAREPVGLLPRPLATLALATRNVRLTCAP